MQARERARLQTSTSSTTSSLRFATFNIELRQEIHIAFMMNRPLPLCFVGYSDIDCTLQPTDDWMWTYRISAHTAATLNHCNGTGPKTLERWKELWEYLDRWEEAVPASFRPIFQEDADPTNGKLFPDVWLANDCHGECCATSSRLSTDSNSCGTSLPGTVSHFTPGTQPSDTGSWTRSINGFESYRSPDQGFSPPDLWHRLLKSALHINHVLRWCGHRYV